MSASLEVMKLSGEEFSRAPNPPTAERFIFFAADSGPVKSIARRVAGKSHRRQILPNRAPPIGRVWSEKHSRSCGQRRPQAELVPATFRFRRSKIPHGDEPGFGSPEAAFWHLLAGVPRLHFAHGFPSICSKASAAFARTPGSISWRAPVSAGTAALAPGPIWRRLGGEHR